MTGAKGPTGGSGHEGGRSLKVRVKSAGKRTMSSKLWLERQLNDPYVAAARREGWRSRAVYKLIELDERFHFFKPGQKIIDLGAAPGGWAQYAAKKVNSATGKGKVVGIDLLDIEPIAGVEFTVMDFLEPDAPERLKAMLGSEADAVIVRHGRQHHRTQEDRPPAHCASGGACGGIRARGAGARRLLRRQGVSGRRRG
jgi:23S rRNA (uridine2552-2'-O)-methyltransferase